MVNICAKFHCYPSTMYRDTKSCEIGLTDNVWRAGRFTWKPTASVTDSLIVEAKNQTRNKTMNNHDVKEITLCTIITLTIMVDMGLTDSSSRLCQNLSSTISKLQLKCYICSPNDTVNAKTYNTRWVKAVRANRFHIITHSECWVAESQCTLSHHYANARTCNTLAMKCKHSLNVILTSPTCWAICLAPIYA